MVPSPERVEGWLPRAAGAPLPPLIPLALAAAGLVVIVGSPLFGWFPVLRFSAVALPVIGAAVLAAAPWRWRDADWDRAARWAPPGRVLLAGAVAAAALLFWIVLSRFLAGGINAVDFTIYFDRPLFQTSLGHWYFVESTDDARFDYLTHLAVHAYWILLPLAALYWIQATPWWLLALSVIAVVAGSAHVYRIMRITGGSGLLAVAAALAFLLNDNTARTLNYGFHAEVLYAWFIPWAIDAGLRRARGSYVAAVLASVLVKEDAVFPLFALAVVLALHGWREMSGRERAFFLALPVALALANLAAFYTIVVPWLSPRGDVMYSYFWSSHGPTPWSAAKSMAGNPVGLVAGALGSGFFSVVLARHLFLPLAGWRWMIGVVPLVVLYGASDNDQVRAFGIYYAVPLVPFLVLGAAHGARRLAGLVWEPARAEAAAALLVLVSVLSVGLGYSLRPWKPELRQVRAALAALPPGDGEIVLVQSGLYPHAGYATHVKLLAPHTLRDPRHLGAILLLAPGASAYPFSQDTWDCLAALPSVDGMPDGLRAVRLAAVPPRCADLASAWRRAGRTVPCSSKS
jgi:uncharacterized membrane protein